MDPCSELARLTIHHFTRHNAPPSIIPETIHQGLASQRAAAFVSLHTANGALRGCKGTLEPCRGTLEEEIICNAIAACSQDHRFPPVEERELDRLKVQVDVLSALEPIQGPEDLDVKRYGLLVSTADGRRGVLLPDLDGIRTVADQIAIACGKAGIDPRGEAFRMARFTTTRHP